MTAAAMTGPTPNSPVRPVPAARTAAAAFFLVWRIAAQVLGELGGELPAGSRDGVGRHDRCQDVRGLTRSDLLGDTAGDQLAQHLVQPAGHLGAGPAQVLVALGPDLEYRGVIVTAGLPDSG